MKIILNKEEQEKLTELLNSDKLVKQIDFETSEVYIDRIARLITNLMSDVCRSYRVGYKYNLNTGKLLFKNDFLKIDDKKQWERY